MQVCSMAPQLIEIYNIRNLEAVYFKDLLTSSSEKMTVVPSLLIKYDGGKVLNLCSSDMYFDTFVRKVAQVYKDEKDNIREDSLTDPFKLRSHIDIDSKTQMVLESGILEKVDDIYAFYDGKQSYNSSLIFQIDEVNLLLPIIKYHLKKLFSLTDIIVNFEDGFKGFRTNYALDATINGVDTNVFISFNKLADEEYGISISGLSNNMPVDMRISFKDTSLEVYTSIPKYGISGTFSYFSSSEVVKSLTVLQKNGKTISYENKDLESEDFEYLNVAEFDNPGNMKWFRLPWGASIGINNNIMPISEAEKIVESHFCYFSLLNDHFMKKEYFQKTYRRNKTATLDAKEMALDKMIKYVLGYLADSKRGIYLVETKFLDELAGLGYYNEKLKGKHFYHIGEFKDGLKSFDQKGLITIGPDNNIISNSDILNKARLRQLVDGE